MTDKMEAATNNREFLEKATQIGQTSPILQRYIVNSNCYSEDGLARVAGLVALEYLADHVAAAAASLEAKLKTATDALEIFANKSQWSVNGHRQALFTIDGRVGYEIANQALAEIRDGPK